ncbi:MAG: hypothetical protein KC910_06390, partial [Candidatus Eremiobacteraeota bacterium]|nr:hypothetical protein [Candidatus Eremiobacteraeota bacterium]
GGRIMSLLLMAGAWWFGLQVARHLLKETDRALAAALGAGLGLVGFLLLVNLVGYWVPPRVGAVLACALLVAMGLLLARRTPPAWEKPLLERPALLFVVGLSLLMGLYCTLAQNLNIDDDYWIHAPLQGIMCRSGLPAHHPFFPDIKLHGHYGRDLLIASMASLGGTTQGWQIGLTSVWTMLAWILLVLTLRRSIGATEPALAGALMVFFGIAVGGRGGALDTFQNNNSLVHVLMVLVLFLIERTWRGGDPVVAGLCGACLGSLAIVYETHFGLLSMVLLAGGLLGPRSSLKRRLGRVALALLVAGLLAISQGGVFTGLVKRGGPTNEVEMTQHQTVRLRFPKRNFGCVRLGYGGFQRMSYARRWLARPRTVPAGGNFYAPIWSLEVLQLHWFATWLAPLSAIFLWRRGQWLAGGYWLFGLFAYTVPGVVDFGPVFEFEYFRWQYAAGLGFACALGVVVGLLWRDGARPRRLLVLLILMLCLGPWLSTFAPPVWRAARSYPLAMVSWSGPYWLRENGYRVQIDRDDLSMARYLRQVSQPGQRVLVDFPAGGGWDIYYESTFHAIAGLFSVGHSLPEPGDPVGFFPYRAGSSTRAFWANPSLERLALLAPDWVLFRPGPMVGEQTLEQLQALPELEEVKTVGELHLFRARVQPLEAHLSEEQVPLRLGGVQTPDGLQAGHTYPAVVKLQNSGQEALPAGSLLAYRTPLAGQPLSLIDVVVFRLDSELPVGGSARIEIPLAVPYAQGQRFVFFYQLVGQEFRPIPGAASLWVASPD